MYNKATADDNKVKELLRRAYGLLEDAERVRSEKREAYREMKRCKATGFAYMAYENEKKYRQCLAEIRKLKLRLTELELDARVFFGW